MNDLETPIVVQDNAKAQMRSFRDLGFFFGFLALAGALVPGSWPVSLMVAFAMALFLPWGYRHARRSLGHGAVLDGQGIALTFHGERTDFLDWSDYGGYRPSRKGGYEVLDRRGGPVLCLTLPSNQAAVLAELDLRVPEGGFPYDRFRKRVPSGRTVAKAVVVTSLGAAMLGVGLAAGGTSRLFALAPLGFLALAGGLAVGAIEIPHLVRRKRGIDVPTLLPPSVPEEGPTAERHLVRHAERPILLQEGRRYRTVDPERRRAELQVAVSSYRAMFRLGLLFPTLALFMAIVRPESWVTGLFVAVLNVFMPLSMLLPLRIKRRLLDAVDDTLWVHGGELIAVRSDGTTLRLPLPTNTDAQAVQSLKGRGVTDVLRARDGQGYPLDRTRLYEAPNAVE